MIIVILFTLLPTFFIKTNKKLVFYQLPPLFPLMPLKMSAHMLLRLLFWSLKRETSNKL